MKKILIAAMTVLMITVQFACTKTEVAQTVPAASQELKFANKADMLNSITKNASLIDLVNNASAVAPAVAIGTQFTEFNDGQITVAETETLYRKLGFSSAADCKAWLIKMTSLQDNLKKNYPKATGEDFKQAYQAHLNWTRRGAKVDSPCTDNVIGSFVMNVTQCAALGLIPIAGTVLAGTCMTGALISYMSGLNGCKTTDKKR